MSLAVAEPRIARRVEPLAVLPVFMNLVGRHAVVLGGSDPAAWKAELLAAAGANVVVFADGGPIGQAMQALIESGAAAGSVSLMHGDWTAGDFVGATLVIADIESDIEAENFVQAARSAGVPYNVIDRPDYCSFQFGGIVNRSPVVIGISTNGAAPILGQAVRRRIETVLPRTLAAWGKLAGEVRHTIMQRLPKAATRRRFWEHFADLAFGPAPDPARNAHVHTLIASLVDQAPLLGRITLVGAGPGDAELLTLKAMRALQSADVILFDDLVSDEVLELARREARRMLVGKRAHRDDCRQEDINGLMLSLARQGKHVVRLKSGDPMILGRAGEEIAALEAEGITVEVVPGIAASPRFCLAAWRVPDPSRLCPSARFVTDHPCSGRQPDTLDRKAIADPSTTNVFHMSRRTIGDILDRLRRMTRPETLLVSRASI